MGTALLCGERGEGSFSSGLRPPQTDPNMALTHKCLILTSSGFREAGRHLPDYRLAHEVICIPLRNMGKSQGREKEKGQDPCLHQVASLSSTSQIHNLFWGVGWEMDPQGLEDKETCLSSSLNSLRDLLDPPTSW